MQGVGKAMKVARSIRGRRTIDAASGGPVRAIRSAADAVDQVRHLAARVEVQFRALARRDSFGLAAREGDLGAIRRGLAGVPCACTATRLYVYVSSLVINNWVALRLSAALSCSGLRSQSD